MSDVTESKPKTPPALRRKRGTWRRVLLGLVILVCGMFIGAGGGLILVRHVARRAAEHPERVPPRATARLTKVLSLSEEQATEVEAIIARRLGALDRIKRDAMPHVAEELEGARAEIEAVLNDEQKIEWRKRWKRIRRSFPVAVDSLIQRETPDAPAGAEGVGVKTRRAEPASQTSED